MSSNPPPLDRRLIEEAIEILQDDGIEALTLRRVAREAGVSHGAPLRHFGSFSDLLAEVAAEGYRRLSDALAAAVNAVPPNASARARMNAAGHGYIAVAMAHPALFALMFRPDRLDVANESFRREADAAFERLVVLVRAAQGEGYEPAREPRMLAGCVWAAVHGLATLWSQGALPSAVPEARFDEAVDTTLDLLFPATPRS